MDPAYPHYDNADRFTAWLFSRLNEIANIKWDESIVPVHSSYEDWWAWGQCTGTFKPGPASPTNSTATRLTATPSRDDSAIDLPLRPNTLARRPSSTKSTSTTVTSPTFEPILARISRHGLRLERQYQLARNHVSQHDPDGNHYLRPIQLVRLPSRSQAEPQLSVILYNSPGPNAVVDLINCGPAWFPATQLGNLRAWREQNLQRNLGAKPVSICTFLAFAIGACEALEILHHGNRTVHGEIRSDSFHYDKANGTVRLVNLGSGVRSLERGLSSSGWLALSKEFGIEHKLNFVAPEMTGRLPAQPDLRTDCYSLGILFYLMLTGELPFHGSQALEILQQVLSRRVPLLTSKRDDVPACLAHLIQRLVQKNIEDRYHSMSGVKYDLEQIQKYFDEGDKEALGKFALATRDVNSFFTLPNIQIGRDQDRARIIKVIDRTAGFQRRVDAAHKRMASPKSSRSSDSSDTDSLTMSNKSRSSPGPGTISTNANDSAVQLPPTVLEDIPDSEFSIPFEKRVSIDNSSRLSASSPADGSSGILRSASKYKRKGKTEVVTISGEPGLGKSSLLQSVWVNARNRGYIATSKFDQSKHTPFEAVLSVMKSLFRQIFSETNLDTPFHIQLRAFVRSVWGMLSTMLELPESLLDNGNPPTTAHKVEVAADGSPVKNGPAINGVSHTHADNRASSESRLCGSAGNSIGDFLRTGTASKSSRFMAVFIDVLRFLATQKLLVLVLDDLQFADDESLDLISGVIGARIPLMIILTYRYKDQLPIKATDLLSEIPSMTDISLSPLREEDVAEYVVATLHRSREYIFPLVAVIYDKTHGNPFFMKEMLETSFRKGCIKYNWKENQWEYSLDLVFQQFSSSRYGYGDQMDNSFIVDRLNDLPSVTRQFLLWASMLGTTFSFSLVKALMSGHHGSSNHRRSDTDEHIAIDGVINADASEVLNKPHAQPQRAELPRQTSQDALRGLQGALAAFVIMPGEDDNHFRWCHDRYQHAAAGLVDKKQSAEMHFEIAHLLMETQEFDEEGDNVWTRASHICACVDMIRERVPIRGRYRDALFRAAEKANESGGRVAGLTYLTNALALLQTKDPWISESNPDVVYTETLQLFSKTAESYFHQGHVEPALQLIAVIIRRAQSAFDKVPAWILQSRIIARRGDNGSALKVLVKCLGHLGVEVPATTWEECDEKFKKLRQKVDSTDLDALLNRAVSQDETLTVTATVLIEALASAFWTDGLVFYQLSLLEVDLAFLRGTTTSIGLGFIHMGTCAIGRFDEVQFGCKMGFLALKMVQRHRNDVYAFGRGLTLYCLLLGQFSIPMKQCITQLESAMDACLAAGDRFGALLNVGFVASARLWASQDLVDIESFCNFGAEEISGWQDDVRGGVFIFAVRQCVKALQGKTYRSSAATIMSDDTHDATNYMQYVAQKLSNPARAQCTYDAYTIIALYAFGYYEEVVELANHTIPLLREYWSARFYISVPFYWALAQFAIMRDNPDLAQKEAILDEIRAIIKRITTGGAVNDVNFLSWSSILKAQLYEMEERYSECLRTYEEALDHADVHELRFEYGMCSELYGDWLIRRGSKRPAKHAFEDAISWFRRMSAFAKAQQIEEKHEWLLRGTTSLQSQDASTQTIVGSHALMSHEGQENPDQTRPDDHVAEADTSQPTQDLGISGLDMIDLTGILQSTRVLASELQTDKLYPKMCRIILESTSAEFCAIIYNNDDDEGWSLGASADVFGNEHESNQRLDEAEEMVGKQIVLFSIRFRELVFVTNLYDDHRFSNVPEGYRKRHPEGRAAIALPIIRGDKEDGMLLGCVYLEAPPHTLTQRNVNVARLLVSSLGVSIANAKLFRKVEKVSAHNEAIVEAQKSALARTKASELKAKASENEAKAAVRRAEEAAKAKTAFLANVSHELRTPLNGVIGMSELLKGTQNLSSEQEGYADSIRVCADTLLTVINDILDFSKLEAGKMQLLPVPLSITETVEEVVRALSFSGHGKELKTVVDIELDKDLVVFADVVRLHQVLMNLLSNAYKFTPNGSVTVQAKAGKETDDEITVTCAVKDTGIGISEESKAKLFLPFSQGDSSTARSYGGTGLGLSICRAIVGVMGGKIWLDSVEGQGTTVSFSLTLKKVHQKEGKTKSGQDPMAIYSPVEAVSPNETVSPDLQELAKVPREKLRVAIAEDNLVNSRIAQQFVKKLGLQPTAFENGQQAVDALTQASKEGNPFHVVLMDVQMPVLDGYDATRAIRKHSDPQVRRVLIIAMTASAIRGDREKCLDAGMNNYLAKPVRQNVLKQMLDSYISNDIKAVPSLHRDSTNGEEEKTNK